MSVNDEKYPEVLLDLRDNLAELLEGAGAEPSRARQIAEAAAEVIRKKWGGLAIYIPKGQAVELSQRDREIYRRYNGSNKHLLCREYEISEQWLYQIIARMRAEEVAKRQMRLFE